MRDVARHLALVLLSLASVAGARAADTVQRTPAADTVIYFDGVGGSSTLGASNGLGDNLSVGQDNGGMVRRSLIRFDLSGVAPGRTVESVSLSLFEPRSRANYDVALHRLLAPWGEGGSNAGSGGGSGAATAGDATWMESSHPGTLWSMPGGDFVGQASAVTFVGFAGASYAWSSAAMAADVQGWIDAPSTNHGWILIGVETVQQNAKLFSSGESASPPLLSVQLAPVPEPSMLATLLAGAGLIGWRLRRGGVAQA